MPGEPLHFGDMERHLILGDRLCMKCGYNLRGLRVDGNCPECGTASGLPDSGLLDDRPCLRCGYSLQGLRADGRCPECGTEVARSLQGNLLVYSAPGFVWRLSAGALCVLIGVFTFCLYLAIQVFAVMNRWSGPSSTMLIISVSLLSLTSSLLSLVGWWLLSCPDPALVGKDKATSARRVLRVSLIIAAAAFLLGTASRYVLNSRDLAWGFWYASLLIWPVKTIASLQYTKSLAYRIPSLTLVHRARFLVKFSIFAAVFLVASIVMVIILEQLRLLSEFGVLTFIPMCGTVIGVVVWFATYTALVGALRSALVRVIKTQALQAR